MIKIIKALWKQFWCEHETHVVDINYYDGFYHTHCDKCGKDFYNDLYQDY